MFLKDSTKLREIILLIQMKETFPIIIYKKKLVFLCMSVLKKKKKNHNYCTSEQNEMWNRNLVYTLHLQYLISTKQIKPKYYLKNVQNRG